MKYPPFLTMFATLVVVSTALGVVHSYHPREGLGIYPEIAPFTAAPAVIRAGDSATLSWASRGADSLILVSIPEDRPEAAEEIRGLPPAGSITVHPLASTTYLMRCVTVSSTLMCNHTQTTIDVTGTPRRVPNIIESGGGK
jgi:hypothetical protein